MGDIDSYSLFLFFVERVLSLSSNTILRRLNLSFSITELEILAGKVIKKSNTEFVNCTFCPGYAVDTTRATVTFTDCTFEE